MARSRGEYLETDEETEEPQWYRAVGTYKAIHIGKPRRKHLWERTVFLVRAINDSEAMVKAADLARSKEVEYLAAGGDQVRWVLQEVESVLELGESALEDGSEVYWEFFERVDKVPTAS